jgi:RNA polymerase sigma factor (sigma-70 family)
MTDTPIGELLGRVRNADEAAAGELVRTFEPFLRGLVRRRLPAEVRGRFDSADVVQSAWASLLGGLRDGRWEFADAAHLRAFLARVVLFRLYDRARSALAQTGREEPLGEFAADLPGGEPRPSEHVRAAAAWDALLAACPPEHRPILHLRRLGYSCEEIGAETGLHPGSVRRVLRNLARKVAFDPSPGQNPHPPDDR